MKNSFGLVVTWVSLFSSLSAFAQNDGGHFGDIRGEILDKPFREDQQTQRKELRDRENNARKATRAPGQVDSDKGSKKTH